MTQSSAVDFKAVKEKERAKAAEEGTSRCQGYLRLYAHGVSPHRQCQGREGGPGHEAQGERWEASHGNLVTAAPEGRPLGMMRCTRTHAVHLDSCGAPGLMQCTRTHGVHLDSWGAPGLMR